MDYFRTQYEKCYEGDEYYWGLEPAAFLDGLVEITAKNISFVPSKDRHLFH